MTRAAFRTRSTTGTPRRCWRRSQCSAALSVSLGEWRPDSVQLRIGHVSHGNRIGGVHTSPMSRRGSFTAPEVRLNPPATRTTSSEVPVAAGRRPGVLGELRRRLYPVGVPRDGLRLGAPRTLDHQTGAARRRRVHAMSRLRVSVQAHRTARILHACEVRLTTPSPSRSA
jgi:hypothetical protein